MSVELMSAALCTTVAWQMLCGLRVRVPVAGGQPWVRATCTSPPCAGRVLCKQHSGGKCGRHGRAILTWRACWCVGGGSQGPANDSNRGPSGDIPPQARPGTPRSLRSRGLRDPRPGIARAPCLGPPVPRPHVGRLRDTENPTRPRRRGVLQRTRLLPSQPSVK